MTSHRDVGGLGRELQRGTRGHGELGVNGAASQFAPTGQRAGGADGQGVSPHRHGDPLGEVLRARVWRQGNGRLGEVVPHVHGHRSVDQTGVEGDGAGDGERAHGGSSRRWRSSVSAVDPAGDVVVVAGGVVCGELAPQRGACGANEPGVH